MNDIVQEAGETVEQFMARCNREATLKQYAADDAHREANKQQARMPRKPAWADAERKRYVPYERPTDSSVLGVLVEVAVDLAFSAVDTSSSVITPDFSGGGGDFSGGGASGSW